MESASAASGHTVANGITRWTLADLFSTYRYWALFGSIFILEMGMQGLTSVLPWIMRDHGNSYQSIGLFSISNSSGWAIGAFLAFVAAPRRGRPALVFPIIVLMILTIVILVVPNLWSQPIYLCLYGMAQGSVRGVIVLAAAIFLFAGRPDKIDFGCALTLLSSTMLTGIFGATGLSLLTEADPSGIYVILCFLAFLVAALALLLPLRQPSFEDEPRQRHNPLTPRERSPVTVALILLLAPLLVVAISIALYLLQEQAADAGAATIDALLFSIAAFVIAIAGLIYLAWWIYRIHGELAGAEKSQRLLTPLAALLIAILVPLGLPILLMTLGDLLNDRGRKRRGTKLVSIVWLAIWTLLMPPIAIALIQNAANKSYQADQAAA
ncbi:hypothetical protein HGP17_24045 [Rhizobium sp. P38BS-XIX]|nr:hypothetical protein [Rhizobium sp. P38BS-XIX]